MAHTHETEFERDDETVVYAEYTISNFVKASYRQPAEGGEVEIVKVTDADGNLVQYTADEDEEWSSLWISENHKFDDGLDGYD
jgi:hypothetical protein